MLLLALDTSTSAASVALRDESGVIATSHVVDAQAHGEILAPGLRAVFEEAGRRPADLTHVVAGVGPGPFTGLRVGVVSALTLGHVTGVTPLGLCSLDGLAQGAHRCGVRGRLLVATDARRKEVYHGVYDLTDDAVAPAGEAQVARAQDLPEEVRALPVVGRGALLWGEHLGEAAVPDLLDVHAADLADLAAARLAAGAAFLPVEPLYLRRPDAVPAASVKSVLPR